MQSPIANITAAVFFSILGVSPVCVAATVPSTTAVPVQFTHTIDASKAKPGDAVTARTLQVIVLPDGQLIPKGTTVLGHVVAANPFQFNSTPYAVQTASSLSVHFDSLREKGETIPVSLSVRALADDRLSEQAATPHFLANDSGIAPTIDQIGGDQYAPAGKTIESANGDVVGYNRKQGAFARLIANVSQNGSVACDATNTEQSVAIFSASACGLYGFGSKASLSENGQANGGTFRVESIGYNFTLGQGSTALLQVTEPASFGALRTE